MMIHDLKIDSSYFFVVLSGEKTFEIRENDRGFKVGDYILLNEWDTENREYTGRNIKCVITYLTQYEQKEGYVVFSFEKI